MIKIKDIEQLYKDAAQNDGFDTQRGKDDYKTLACIFFISFLVLAYMKVTIFAGILFIICVLMLGFREKYFSHRHMKKIDLFLNTLFYIDKNSNVFHIANCEKLKHKEILRDDLVKVVDIYSSNYLMYETYDEAINLGYKPCNSCLIDKIKLLEDINMQPSNEENIYSNEQFMELKSLRKGDMIFHKEYGKLTVDRIDGEYIYMLTESLQTKSFLIGEYLQNNINRIEKY